MSAVAPDAAGRGRGHPGIEYLLAGDERNAQISVYAVEFDPRTVRCPRFVVRWSDADVRSHRETRIPVQP